MATRDFQIYTFSCTTQKAKENVSRPKPTALRALPSNQCPALESCPQSCRRYSNGRLLLFFLFYFSSSISCEQTKGRFFPPSSIWISISSQNSRFRAQGFWHRWISCEDYLWGNLHLNMLIKVMICKASFYGRRVFNSHCWDWKKKLQSE